MSTYTESLHPRGPGGKFAAKQKQQQAAALPAGVQANIKDFQKRMGLKVTGQFDAATMAKIHSESSAKKSGGGSGGGSAAKKQAATLKHQAALAKKAASAQKTAQRKQAAAQKAKIVAVVKAVNSLPTASRATYRGHTSTVPPGYLWTANDKLVPDPTANQTAASKSVQAVLNTAYKNIIPGRLVSGKAVT